MKFFYIPVYSPTDAAFNQTYAVPNHMIEAVRPKERQKNQDLLTSRQRLVSHRCISQDPTQLLFK